MSKDSDLKAAEFLQDARSFQLGGLPTESQHPKTPRLSQMAQENLLKALDIFVDIDRTAVLAVQKQLRAIDQLTTDIASTLVSGGKIFLCGCGATGRLSVSLETLWREEMVRLNNSAWQDRVVGFIAGGDFALVKSIENFEDHPEFGVRQLLDLGFTDNDLLISSTEGGETPFVIGATEEAARKSKRKPYFLFCNPEDVLIQSVERSRRVLQNQQINCISLETGPMALSGSTRLQATTALMLAIGAALFSVAENQPAKKWVQEFLRVLDLTQWRSLAPLIEAESAIYKSKSYCVHSTSRYGVTVLTDTTERTPTFSLTPFENAAETHPQASWTYLSIPEAKNSKEAWQKVLGRQPRSLKWEKYQNLFGLEKTLEYDFSEQSLVRRRNLLGADKVHLFSIEDHKHQITLSLDKARANFAKPESLLSEHLLVKCLLNMTSTLVMGRLGRFYSNIMVFVRPTNKKLIDRSIRYIQLLLKEEGFAVQTYEKICYALFEEFEKARQDEPVVVRTFERLKLEKSAP
jgi:N-acetylmuramic acid 6-phosphate etherase